MPYQKWPFLFSRSIEILNYIYIQTFGGDKVSMLTHIYPHKPLRKIKWPYAVTKLPGQADSESTLCGMMFDCKHTKNYVQT